MKIICLVLCLVISVLSGLLVFTAQSGHLPMTKEEEVQQQEVIAQQQAGGAPLISSQIGLIDELSESLLSAHDDLENAKLRFDKREKNLQELYATYLKLRSEVETMLSDLDARVIRIEENELKNFKKIAGVYSKMEPSSAAQALKFVEVDRVAIILSQMDSRGMAAIMDEAVSSSPDGGEFVAQWSDAIRRLNDGKDEF